MHKSRALNTANEVARIEANKTTTGLKAARLNTFHGHLLRKLQVDFKCLCKGVQRQAVVDNLKNAFRFKVIAVVISRSFTGLYA